MTALGSGLWLLAQAAVGEEPPTAPAAPQPPVQTTPAPPTVPQGRADENAVRQAEDAFGTIIGCVASTVNNDLFIPARTLVDIGSRYRFTIGKNRATLRVSVSNLFNVYAWDYYGPSTFDYVPQRLANAYLAVDL